MTVLEVPRNCDIIFSAGAKKVSKPSLKPNITWTPREKEF